MNVEISVKGFLLGFLQIGHHLSGSNKRGTTFLGSHTQGPFWCPNKEGPTDWGSCIEGPTVWGSCKEGPTSGRTHTVTSTATHAHTHTHTHECSIAVGTYPLSCKPNAYVPYTFLPPMADLCLLPILHLALSNAARTNSVQLSTLAVVARWMAHRLLYPT